MENIHSLTFDGIIIYFIKKHKHNPGITKAQVRELKKSGHRLNPEISKAIEETDYFKIGTEDICEKPDLPKQNYPT